MSEPLIVTLGCRLNTFESEVIRANLQDAGAGSSDTVVINTCAVTSEAERQARQTIRRLRRERPAAKIIVTGCAAQLNPDSFADMPEVDQVLGNADKLDVAAYATGDGSNSATRQVSDIMDETEITPHLITGFDNRTRAFVQVQQGCDHRCTFCIIPFARGPNRSVAPDDIIKQVATLVQSGYAEVVLTGVDICSYGFDDRNNQTPGLATLVRNILAEIPDLARLRLSSLDPARIDDDLLDVFANEPRIMPHLHLSLQSGDNMILKRMKRRHTREDVIAICNRARDARPDMVLGADLIAGFPTETNAMFENTLAAIEDMGLSFLHVFPFSPRPDTPAALMPQVAGSIRKVRAAKIRAAGDAALTAFLHSRIGSQADVLVEQGRRGRTEQFAPVTLTFDAPVGTIVPARMTGVEEDALIGQACPHEDLRE